MRRHHRLFLEDMLSSSKNIEEYVGTLSLEEFIRDKMRIDAVVRNFEVMGEASAKVPVEVRDRYPSIEWQKISDFRNVLIHEYFGVSHEILWDVIKNKIPSLIDQLSLAIEKEP